MKLFSLLTEMLAGIYLYFPMLYPSFISSPCSVYHTYCSLFSVPDLPRPWACSGSPRYPRPTNLPTNRPFGNTKTELPPFNSSSSKCHNQFGLGRSGSLHIATSLQDPIRVGGGCPWREGGIRKERGDREGKIEEEYDMR